MFLITFIGKSKMLTNWQFCLRAISDFVWKWSGNFPAQLVLSQKSVLSKLQFPARFVICYYRAPYFYQCQISLCKNFYSNVLIYYSRIRVQISGKRAEFHIFVYFCENHSCFGHNSCIFGLTCFTTIEWRFPYMNL